MEQVTLSLDMLVGLVIGVFVPALFWAWRMFAMTKQLHKMHMEPDDHGFGSDKIQKTLEDHLVEENEFHREIVDSNQALRYALKELSHFMRWMVKERTGKEPPPYVRNDS